ncbi:hypothetical protein CALVIDRAFT_543011 [Calocera viscosa TUFC12733]|uniref:Uncharacterized protein n=1 Tax=Calocera viscosa (strain TUFC12733) TaxID=1330018 RepID=A0A167G2K7_CALVF|nr:hypothetical protein CALVIDRAFT_543011 [Calocera viscosa TUFC12733]
MAYGLQNDQNEALFSARAVLRKRWCTVRPSKLHMPLTAVCIPTSLSHASSKILMQGPDFNILTTFRPW